MQEETEQEIQRLLKIKETITKTYTTFAIAKSKLLKYGIGMENMEFVKSLCWDSKGKL